MRETHHWGELRIQGTLKRLQGANIKAHYCKPGICTFKATIWDLKTIFSSLISRMMLLYKSYSTLGETGGWCAANNEFAFCKVYLKKNLAPLWYPMEVTVHSKLFIPKAFRVLMHLKPQTKTPYFLVVLILPEISYSALVKWWNCIAIILLNDGTMAFMDWTFEFQLAK